MLQFNQNLVIVFEWLEGISPVSLIQETLFMRIYFRKQLLKERLSHVEPVECVKSLHEPLELIEGHFREAVRGIIETGS